MPMQWNEQADAKLFANVLKIHIVKLDYQALAKAMGETVTPKAISHRISKIKEKAQMRRFDWEIHNNPPTSCTPKKRGPKARYTDDDDGVLKKKVKAEKTVAKVEESAWDSNHTTAPWGIAEYYWSKEWPPTPVITSSKEMQHTYPPYDFPETNTNEATTVGYSGGRGCDNADRGFAMANVAGCNDAGVHLDCDNVVEAAREVEVYSDTCVELTAREDTST